MNPEQQSGAGHQSGFVPLNGMNMYYEIHGTGRPLVLVHGGGSTLDTTFGRVIPFFAAGHQVIVPELQAHGHTPDRDTPLTFSQDADDVAGMLRFLGIDNADVLGFSNGGTTALQLAIRHPGMVGKLVVASAFSKRSGAQPFLWEFLHKATYADMPVQLKDAFLAIDPDESHLIRMHDRDLFRMQNFPDIPDEDLRGIRAETLILTGDRDVLTPEHAVELSRLIPDARLMILPGGHGEYLGEVTTLQDGRLSYVYAAGLIEDFLKK